MTDTCGLTSCEPFARWDRDSQCWKTSEATSLWALTLSSLTLPQWGGLHDGELCEHPTPELATSGHDSSSLPTPTRADYRSHNSNPGARNQGGGVMPASEHSLPAKIAAMLPTPRTTDSHGAGLHGQGGQDLRTVVSLLPTPAVNDMGEGKTLEWWDDWAPRQKAADGRPAPHGRSLAIEAQRLLPTPRATDGTDAPANLTPSVEAICDGSAGRTPRLSEMAVGRMLPTPTSQAAKHGETPDTTASGYGSNLWDLPSLLPTPKATNNENRQSLDRYGMNLGMALESIGAITAPPLSDGSASLDDQPHRQLSLDELAHPA